jgi:hypothetical protein
MGRTGMERQGSPLHPGEGVSDDQRELQERFRKAYERATSTQLHQILMDQEDRTTGMGVDNDALDELRNTSELDHDAASGEHPPNICHICGEVANYYGDDNWIGKEQMHWSCYVERANEQREQITKQEE